MNAEAQGRSARTEARYSPDAIHVDMRNDDDGTYDPQAPYTHNAVKCNDQIR